MYRLPAADGLDRAQSPALEWWLGPRDSGTPVVRFRYSDKSRGKFAPDPFDETPGRVFATGYHDLRNYRKQNGKQFQFLENRTLVPFVKRLFSDFFLFPFGHWVFNKLVHTNGPILFYPSFASSPRITRE